jgi:hypothetical protein
MCAKLTIAVTAATTSGTAAKKAKRTPSSLGAPTRSGRLFVFAREAAAAEATARGWHRRSRTCLAGAARRAGLAEDGESAVPVHLRGLPSRRFPRVLEATAYFVVEAALASAAEHPGVTQVSLLVDDRADRLVVEVCHDGGGEPWPVPSLAVLAERAAAVVEVPVQRLDARARAGEIRGRVRAAGRFLNARVSERHRSLRPMRAARVKPPARDDEQARTASSTRRSRFVRRMRASDGHRTPRSSSS